MESTSHKDADDESLLSLRESHAHERSNCQLPQGICRYVGAVMARVVVNLGQHFDQGHDAVESGLEKTFTLLEQHMVDSIPWVLVKGGNHALMGANEDALGARDGVATGLKLTSRFTPT